MPVPTDPILYEKIGRRYHPVRHQFQAYADSLPKGDYLIVSRPHGRTLRPIPLDTSTEDAKPYAVAIHLAGAIEQAFLEQRQRDNTYSIFQIAQRAAEIVVKGEKKDGF